MTLEELNKEVETATAAIDAARTHYIEMVNKRDEALKNALHNDWVGRYFKSRNPPPGMSIFGKILGKDPKNEDNFIVLEIDFDTIEDGVFIGTETWDPYAFIREQMVFLTSEETEEFIAMFKKNINLSLEYIGMKL